MWVRLKLTPKGDHTKWANNYIVTFHPKHPKWDQNLRFAPLSEKKNIPVTSIREYPPPYPAPSCWQSADASFYQHPLAELFYPYRGKRKLQHSVLQDRCICFLFLLSPFIQFVRTLSPTSSWTLLARKPLFSGKKVSHLVDVFLFRWKFYFHQVCKYMYVLT